MWQWVPTYTCSHLKSPNTVIGGHKEAQKGIKDANGCEEDKQVQVGMKGKCVHEWLGLLHHVLDISQK